MPNEEKDKPEIIPVDIASFMKEREQTETIILSQSYVKFIYKKVRQLDLLEGIEDIFILPLPTKDTDIPAGDIKESKVMSKKETAGNMEYLKTVCRVGALSPVLLKDKKDLKKANQLPIDYLDIPDLSELGMAILRFSGLADRGELQSETPK